MSEASDQLQALSVGERDEAELVLLHALKLALDSGRLDLTTLRELDAAWRADIPAAIARALVKQEKKK